MSKLSLFATASVLSIVVAGSVVTPAYAWHPKGTIIKSVQNVTAGGSLSDANNANTAISAKPGDILNYVVEVKNTAAPATKQYNDMDFTVVTDSLPTGVELVSNPSTRVLKEEMGLILPGKSKRVEYKVKVISATDGAVVTNKACFTADSVVKDNPQKGCDDAVIKVSVPPVVTPPVTPQPPVTPPVTPKPPVVTPVAPAALPNVGTETFLAPLFGVMATAAGYFGNMLRLKRRLA